MAPIVLSLSWSPMASADIWAMSLYSDVRTYFQSPPCSVHLHRVCTVKGDAGVAGMKRLVVVEKNVHNVLYSSILFFLLLDSRILQSIEPNGEPDGERENKVESTHKNTNTVALWFQAWICGRKVDWKWIALWLMLDGEPEVPTLVYIQFTKYFIVTKDVAKKNGIFSENEGSPLIFYFCFL